MRRSMRRRVVSAVTAFTLLTMGLGATAFADDAATLPAESGQSADVADTKQSDSAQSDKAPVVDAVQSEQAQSAAASVADAPAFVTRSMPKHVNDGDLVKWEESFPDAVLRSAVQDRFVNPSGVTYRNLKSLTYIEVAGKPLTNLKGIELLTGLSSLDLSKTQVESVDVSALTKLDSVELTDTPICPKVPFERHGRTAYFNTKNCGTPPWGRIPFSAGAYELDGKQHTFAYSEGSGSTSFFNVSPATEDKVRPYSFSVSPRGTKNVTLIGEKFLREEVRMVQSDGTILHTFTIKIISSESQPTQIVQVLDTELDGNDRVNIFSTGSGSAVISNDSISVYLDTVNLPDGKMYAGRWGSVHDAASILRLLESGGIEITDSLSSRQLTQAVDSAVYYVLNPRTLAPGESVSFSVREALHTVTSTFSARVDYVVPEANGFLTHVGFATRDGNENDVWDISDAPGLPAGYEVLTDREQVKKVVLGHDGQLTVVKVYVKRSDSTVTPPAPPAPPQDDHPDTPQSQPDTPQSNNGGGPQSTVESQKDPAPQSQPSKPTNPKNASGKKGQKLASTGFETTSIALAALLAGGGALMIRRRNK